jgi:BirA family transcriptional regulator, biotin operon repressor / biotin---[acetyl-CoA-carboxylase] ligase
VSDSATGIETAPVRHLTETGSTNEDALAVGRLGVAGPLWFSADRQISGRGRQGRGWASPVGNLYCTLLLPLAAEPAVLPQMSHVAAVALADAIGKIAHDISGLRIKWPNDLLIDEAKVAGILVEGTRDPSGGQICAVGCGVNCATFPEGLPYRATSLSAAARRPVDPHALFAALRSTLADAVSTWREGAGYPAIRARWLARALPLDTPLVVRGSHQPVSGRFRGIDDNGRLLLMGPHGPIAVEAGEVNLD